MKKAIVLLVSLLIVGCISSTSKIKVTDPKTGNSVTIDEKGVEVDVKTIKNEDIVIEVIEDEEAGK